MKIIQERMKEMIYKEFKNMKLSALGIGMMRLPVIDGDDTKIDMKKAVEIIGYAMENGVNYYDTAWGYHGENSEYAVKEALGRYPRSDYYLADKFPGYDLSNMDKVESIFERQLEKCGVDYFDFYLFHNVCEMNINQYLDEKYGIMDYLRKQKENGRIKHLGFSVHGNIDTTGKFLEKYGAHMEFCQIQLNYLDLKFQDAEAKLKLLSEWDIPIWVMEPLRGGMLTSLNDDQRSVLENIKPGISPAEWAFRFIQSVPGVVVTLSGMSDMEQIKDNIRIFEKDAPLDEKGMEALRDIADDMLAAKILPCTACHYCTSHCPQNLDIPTLLKLYNEHSFTDGGFLAPMALEAMPEDKRPGACIGCRQCESVCPQQIKISEAMADFTEKLKK